MNEEMEYMVESVGDQLQLIVVTFLATLLSVCAILFIAL